MKNQETEAKFYVNDLQRVESRLVELGAVLIQPRVHETNLRFDLPDESLRLGGRALRLRRADDIRLTYKGPSREIEGVRSREEIEFTVGDFESAHRFIETLGYKVFAIYEKFRATYELDECHIMLDELPYGDFVEVEGEGTEQIHSIANSLVLDWEAVVPASYLMLFQRLSADLGIDSGQLTFAALEGLKITSAKLGVRPADEPHP